MFDGIHHMNMTEDHLNASVQMGNGTRALAKNLIYIRCSCNVT